MMEVVVTTGLLETEVVQSSSQIITTNKPTSSFFKGQMPFLSPNQQCHSTEGKCSFLTAVLFIVLLFFLLWFFFHCYYLTYMP